jgi:hypothetical protein
MKFSVGITLVLCIALTWFLNDWVASHALYVAHGNRWEVQGTGWAGLLPIGACFFAIGALVGFFGPVTQTVIDLFKEQRKQELDDIQKEKQYELKMIQKERNALNLEKRAVSEKLADEVEKIRADFWEKSHLKFTEDYYQLVLVKRENIALQGQIKNLEKRIKGAQGKYIRKSTQLDKLKNKL